MELLVLINDAVRDIVALDNSLALKHRLNNRGLQTVSRMFHILTDAQLAADALAVSGTGRSGLIEPIFARDVIAHILVREEARKSEGDGVSTVRLVGGRQRPDVGLEAVFLLTVKIDLERLGILRGSEARLSVSRLEVIGVQRDVSEEIEAPLVVWIQRDVCLVVEI